MTKSKHGKAKIYCAEPGCMKRFDNFAYGHILANKNGWFSQFNGDHWCPDHIPDWVPAWREQQAKKRSK